MGNPFNSRLYNALSWISTLFVMNLVFVAGAGLVIFGGVSCLALFAVVMLLIRDGSYSVSQVLAIVRGNWVEATLWWFANLLLLALMGWEFFVLSGMTVFSLRVTWGAILCLGAVLLVFVNLWIWPFLVLREVSLAELPRFAGFALLVSIRFLPRSLVGAAILIAPPILALVCTSCLWKVLAWLAFFGLAFGAYLIVLVEYPVLEKYLASKSGNAD